MERSYDGMPNNVSAKKLRRTAHSIFHSRNVLGACSFRLVKPNHFQIKLDTRFLKRDQPLAGDDTLNNFKGVFKIPTGRTSLVVYLCQVTSESIEEPTRKFMHEL